MIFLKSQHDVIYEKLNYIKIVKFFRGWEPPFFELTILQLKVFKKQYKILFFGNNFWNTRPNEANEGSMDSDCSNVWKQSILYLLH